MKMLDCLRKRVLLRGYLYSVVGTVQHEKDTSADIPLTSIIFIVALGIIGFDWQMEEL